MCDVSDKIKLTIGNFVSITWIQRHYKPTQ